MYQKLFDKAKSVTKEGACMKFYYETQPLYLETDASRVRLGAALLQTRSGTRYPRDKAPDNSILRPYHIGQQKPVKCGKENTMNIERVALDILNRLEKFHQER